MEYLVDFLSRMVGDPGAAGFVFAAVMGIATMLFGLGAVSLIAAASDPVRRRLNAIVGKDVRSGEQGEALAKAMTPLAPYVIPKEEWARSKVRTRLMHAGYRRENALANFYAIKLLLGIGLAFAVIVGATFYPKLSATQVIGAALALSFVGMMLPDLVLQRLIERRQRLITNGFPDALDLLVSCTEAGLGLNVALQRVADEIGVSHPALADELALVNVQVRAGVDRTDALKELADRTGIEDIRGLVSLLSQSMRFGTSIADTLRVYAEDFRDRRMQRAEEVAAKVGTKLLFPLIFCMFPAFFIVTVGPAVIGVLRAFGGG